MICNAWAWPRHFQKHVTPRHGLGEQKVSMHMETERRASTRTARVVTVRCLRLSRIQLRKLNLDCLESSLMLFDVPYFDALS